MNFWTASFVKKLLRVLLVYPFLVELSDVCCFLWVSSLSFRVFTYRVWLAIASFAMHGGITI